MAQRKVTEILGPIHVQALQFHSFPHQYLHVGAAYWSKLL